MLSFISNIVLSGPAALPGAPPAAGDFAYSGWFWLALAGFVLLTLALATLYLRRLSRSLEESRARLARTEAEWIQALDSAEDAICLLDLDDNLVRANHKYYGFLGRTPEEAVGRNLMLLVHGRYEDKPCPVCQARLERRDAVFVKEADDPVNRLRRPIEIAVKIIRDQRGEATGVLQVMRDLTRQRRAEEAIRESEARFRSLSQAAFEGIAIHEDGHFLAVNQTLASMLGYEPAELIGMHALDLIAPASRELLIERLRSKPDAPAEVEARRKDGTTLPVEIHAKDFSYHGRMRRVVAVRDITELKRAREALFQEKERLMVTLESIGEAVITTDVDGRVQYLNPVAKLLTGWPDEEARGAALAEVFHVIDEATGASAPDPVRACLAVNGIVNAAGDSILRRRDGREFAIEHTAAPIRDRDGGVSGVVLVFRDVTEMRGMARQLSYQASHDPLTGLLNRREFELRLEHALASAQAGDVQHALLYVDLDQFKVVNDTCGHVAGDELLKQLALLLRPRLRGSDTLARLGGDEFGVLLEGCMPAKAREIADGLRQVLSDFRFVWQDKTFSVGASIGIAPITARSASSTEILSAADSACYVAKDLGRNRAHVYQPDDAALAKHQGEMQWMQRVSRAVEDGRLRLYCQAVVPLRDGPAAPARYEILVRMLDEQGKVVPPMAFIPAAERYNVMPAVDRWVIRHALAALRALSESHAAGVAFAINVSGRSLCDDQFLDFVLDQLDAMGALAGRVCFEITETAAIANFAQAQRFITTLKARGCRFALDDFGSGLSSFAYLKNLPVDYLKIDGGFVRDLADDPIDYAMVESINQLGHVMGIQTIAECVENDRILAKLKQLGVDYGQGYGLQRPQPLEEIFAAPASQPHSLQLF
ncbi:EAL domain-containing protein [Thermithiobacillus tepidarius DSM 3134]|uniref:EAL domain-containing protein n=1 Tax=Thermithiobacillus tepidarius TaxID=929 RepID=UPI00041ADE22|nr:EAL domain-containing protein [Thermithiobacillus tepidarius]